MCAVIRSTVCYLRRNGNELGLWNLGSTRSDRPRCVFRICTVLLIGLSLCTPYLLSASHPRLRQSSQQIGDEDGMLSDAVNTAIMENFAAAHRETQDKLNIILEGIQALVESCRVRLAHPTPFPPYNPETEDWESYQHRLQQHFVAFGIHDDAAKRSWFLSWLTAGQFQLLGKLSPSIDPAQLSFHQICSLLQKYYENQPHVITARLEFYNCQKRPNQSYRSWAAELQGLAKRCRFQTASGESYADSMIRDAILRNSPDRGFRIQALQLDNPSTEELLKLAQAFVTSREAGRQVEHWGKTFVRQPAKSPREEPMDLDYTTRRPRRDLRRTAPEPRTTGPWRNTTRRRQLPSCAACFTAHSRAQCPHRWVVCAACGRPGHQEEVCRQTPRPAVAASDSASEESTSQVNTTIRHDASRVYVAVTILNQEVEFQLDTGSVASLINYETYLRLGSPALSPPQLQLMTYNLKEIPLLGQFTVQATCHDQVQALTLLVAKAPRASNLFGLDAFRGFGFQIVHKPEVITTVNAVQYQDQLRERFPTVFRKELGCAKNFLAHIQLKESATPKFCKARPVPVSLEAQVREELQRLEQRGVITPIKYSRWATPVVIVHKPNGSLRICGDFKSTINAQAEVDTYPMPRPEDLYNKLAGCRLYSKIDLAEAYLQLPLDEYSKQFMTINTISGLYRYNRLVFGVASAPAIFQRYMEQLLRGLPHCVTYLDDILVAGSTEEEHDEALHKLLQRLQENGLRCNLEKCQFRQTEVPYLGYVISGKGIHPSSENVAAIDQIPTPTTLKQVQAFIGKISYYRKFIPHAAELLKPLTEMTKKGQSFKWTTECNQAFLTLKAKLRSAPLLVSYQPGKPLVLATDASEVGIGAVLSHQLEDGSERPIAYISKKLNETQRRYSQIEKEALAIVYAVTKFNNYLYGNLFQLVTDHRPLVALFNPSSKLPERTAHRLLRWALYLTKFQYTIRYRSSADHCNADALSRLPQGPDPAFDRDELLCCHIDEDAERTVDGFPILPAEVARETARDPTLQQVIRHVQSQWPPQLPKDQPALQPYWRRRDQLSVRQGVLLLQTDSTQHRVVIPPTLRIKVLAMLHEGHWGLARTKATARAHVFWPGLDKEIETTVRKCKECAAQQAAPAHRFTPWPATKEPWERIHVDFAGPFHNYMWLLLVDAHSKFPFIQKCKSTTATATIKILQQIFALEGLPRTLVTDNGPQFRASEFKQFCTKNGIQLLHSPPFHPQSNGVAERLVRTFKAQLHKFTSQQNVDEAVLKFLSSYRATPTADGASPALKFHGRQPRTLLHLLTPDASTAPAAPQHRFRPGTPVWARGFGPRASWKEGTIIECRGRRICKVRVGDAVVYRHQNQLRPRTTSASQQRPRRSPRLTREREDLWLPPRLSPLPPSPDHRDAGAQRLPSPQRPLPPPSSSPVPGPSGLPESSLPPPAPTPPSAAAPATAPAVAPVPAPSPPLRPPPRTSRRHFAPYAPVGPRRLTDPEALWASTSGGRPAVHAPRLNPAGRLTNRQQPERRPANLSAAPIDRHSRRNRR